MHYCIIVIAWNSNRRKFQLVNLRFGFHIDRSTKVVYQCFVFTENWGSGVPLLTVKYERTPNYSKQADGRTDGRTGHSICPVEELPYAYECTKSVFSYLKSSKCQRCNFLLM